MIKRFSMICEDRDDEEELKTVMYCGEMASCLHEIYQMLRGFTKYYNEETMPKEGAAMAELIRERFSEIVADLPEGIVV